MRYFKISIDFSKGFLPSTRRLLAFVAFHVSMEFRKLLRKVSSYDSGMKANGGKTALDLCFHLVPIKSVVKVVTRSLIF